MEEKPIWKAAIIGSGQVARVSHIPGYQEMKDVEITAVCDTNLKSAEAMAEEFGIPHYFQNHKEMLGTCKPDMVSICVPNKFHCQLVLDALEAGCHVFCEKPPAVSAAEAELMYEASKKAGKVLTYDFHFRHGGNVKTAKRKIMDKELGEIYNTKAVWLRRRGIPGWGNFISKELQGGGPLIDLGVHMLDMALYLLDYPKVSYVCASMSDRIGKNDRRGLMGDWDNSRFTVEDGLFGFLQFENGTSLQLDTAFALNMKEKNVRNVELFGNKGGVSLFPLELYSGGDGALTNTEFPFPQEEDLHFAALRNFVQSIKGKEELLVTALQGLYIQKIIEALYQSAAEKKPVFMES